MTIMNSILVLGLMGLLFGVVLAYAAKKFAVEVDPKVEAVLAALPGANCGGCGFPGCGGLANAIAEGSAPVNACPVGGADTAAKVGEIMGVAASGTDKKVAKVICKGTCSNAKEKFNYEGIQDCKAAAMLGGGSKSCGAGCLGLGTCVNVCKFDAITVEDGVAVINEEKCVACGQCLEACPKSVIDWKPYKNGVVVDCNNKEFGKTVKSKCTVGCIGCQICVKACPFDAIGFENNLAKINYDKCTQCQVCVAKCPTKAISGDLSKVRKVDIEEDKCIGCTICKKNCKFDAIEGELKQKHKIDQDKCAGCHACVEKCPKKAIKIQ